MKKIDYAFWWSEFNWKMYDAATIMFDDNQNDLRALPKSVRLQLLMTLSTVWSTVFSVWVFETIYSMSYGWGGLVLGHLLAIIATYYTFHSFKNVKEKNKKFGVTVDSYDECYDYLEKVDKSK
tara:strand:+ start:231 stop:599 length:369 start_codon:yes stop_codon:yes gene_type:complete